MTVVNPGFLSKRKAPGTYSQMTLMPRTLADEEVSQVMIAHDIAERARVDIVRI